MTNFILSRDSLVLTLVAHSDACPTGDQEVVGLIPAGLATFFCVDLIMNIFLRSFSPFS